MKLDNCKFVNISIEDDGRGNPEGVNFYFREPSMIITEYLDGRENEGWIARENGSGEKMSKEELNEFISNVKLDYDYVTPTEVQKVLETVQNSLKKEEQNSREQLMDRLEPTAKNEETMLRFRAEELRLKSEELTIISNLYDSLKIANDIIEKEKVLEEEITNLFNAKEKDDKYVEEFNQYKQETENNLKRFYENNIVKEMQEIDKEMDKHYDGVMNYKKDDMDKVERAEERYNKLSDTCKKMTDAQMLPEDLNKDLHQSIQEVIDEKNKSKIVLESDRILANRQRDKEIERKRY